MPHRCCVTGCKGNYPTGPKVQVFSFPKDEEMLEKWKRAIPRENLNISKATRVCELHFHHHEIVRTSQDSRRNGDVPRTLSRPSLLSTAVPSVFPNCPHYLSKPASFRVDPAVKRQKLEEKNIQTAIHDSLKEREIYLEAQSIASLCELKTKLPLLKLSDFWSIIIKPTCVLFVNIQTLPAPVIKYSVLVSESLDVTVFVLNKQAHRIGLNGDKFVTKVSSICELGNLLDCVENADVQINVPNNLDKILSFVCEILQTLDLSEYEKSKNIHFIIEQLKLLSSKKLSYTPAFMIFSCLSYSISPCAYKFNRDYGFIIGPHPSTIQRVCSGINLGPQREQCENNFLSYTRSKCKFLKSHEYHVNLLIDEIHLKEYCDYKGGSVVGMVNDECLTANSAYVFMISSILSSFKDVVHILPVTKVTGDILHQWIKRIIMGLEDTGFRVLSVISDNNSINRKAMSSFANPPSVSHVYNHPKDLARPLFFIIDSVHIMKCIWHNWMKQKNNSCMIYPTFQNSDSCVHYACFDTLLKLYDLEHEKLAKYCYGLTLKAMRPNNFEKQNAKLALQIFSDVTANALETLGPKHCLPHCVETANYITLFVRWWKIANVKSPFKGDRLNDEFMSPLKHCTAADPKYSYLTGMLDWLSRWEKINIRYPEGRLTKETCSALRQTTQAFLELSEYCINVLKFPYLLLGKFQTDLLEERFGKYRQLCGGQYNVSIRQVYEVEKKLRLQSVIRLNLKSTVFGEISLQSIQDIFSDTPNTDINIPSLYDKIVINPSEITEISNEDMPVLAYIGGYCCYSILKHTKCEFCKDILVLNDILDDEAMYSLIQNVSRGKLLFPCAHVVSVVASTYLVVQKLCDQFEIEFLKVPNQREVVSNLTWNSILMNELLWERECSSHSAKNICKRVIWIATNVFLNNYTKKKNQSIVKNAVPRKKNIFVKTT